MRTTAPDLPVPAIAPWSSPFPAPSGLFFGGDGHIIKILPHSYINSTHIKILCKKDGKTMNFKT
jgi:hypothetical protein